MVYCKFIEGNDKYVRYAYGGIVSDITGEIMFNFRDDVIEILHTPKKVDAPARHIKRLYGAQRDNFRNGVFKEKISYES